jgi:imidazolonepropionase-like amidohydrolase
MSTPTVNLVIRGKTLIDGTGAQPISSGLVAVAGKRIVYAGPAAGAPDFPDAQLIDLPGATLLPGLIDMHAHPSYYWEEPDAGTYDYEPWNLKVYTPITVALHACAYLHTALMSGVTTARDTGAVAGVMPEVRRAIQQGTILGAKVYTAGRLITPTGGHCHYLPDFSNQADGAEGYRRAVREEYRAGADFIKIAVLGGDTRPEELEAAVDEAHRLGLKVVCHTGKPPAQRLAIEAGADTFEHRTPTREEIDLAAEKGITWTPTVAVSVYYDGLNRKKLGSDDAAVVHAAEKELAESAEYLAGKRESITYAMEAGLKLAAGTDCYARTWREQAMAMELEALVDHGCGPMEALQAATGWAAEAMGWDDIGTLAAGKLADLVAVEGDPLMEIAAMRRVSLVLREGDVVKKDEGK